MCSGGLVKFCCPCYFRIEKLFIGCISLFAFGYLIAYDITHTGTYHRTDRSIFLITRSQTQKPTQERTKNSTFRFCSARI